VHRLLTGHLLNMEEGGIVRPIPGKWSRFFFTSLGKTVTRFRALLFVRLEKLDNSGGIRTVFRRNNGNCEFVNNV